VTEPEAPQNVVSAAALAEAGAAPVEVNADELLAQVQQLQAQMASLLAERGVPADPVAAGVLDLRDHVLGRATSVPDRKDEFADLVKAMKGMSDKPTAQEIEYTRAALDEIRPFEGHEYVRQLAAGLHKLVLKG
jgi:poly-gamma-glutamate capsule biosynthesis protein CapA/YwtB (metallophosphatase superfamily)